MSFESTPDARLIAFHQNIREQIAADTELGSQHRVIGENLKQYAQSLEAEMQRRGLAFVPIAVRRSAPWDEAKAPEAVGGGEDRGALNRQGRQHPQ